LRKSRSSFFSNLSAWRKFGCIQLAPVAHTKPLFLRLKPCYTPTAHSPSSAARDFLVRLWDRSGNDRLFAFLHYSSSFVKLS
jgi:hypothetical protein